MPDDVISQIKSLLTRFFEKREVVVAVDSSIDGGFKIIVGDQEVDLSLKSQVAALEKSLRAEML